MKTLSLLLVSFLSFLTNSGFADSTDQANGCCQTSHEMTAQHKSQQLMLDQIQSETEEFTAHHAVSSHPSVQKNVSDKMDQRTSLSTIQTETENIEVASLQQLTSSVQKRISTVNTVAGQ